MQVFLLCYLAERQKVPLAKPHFNFTAARLGPAYIESKGVRGSSEILVSTTNTL